MNLEQVRLVDEAITSRHSVRAFLNTPIEYLKGIGPQRGESLRKELRVFTFQDLLTFYPYRYVDRTKFHKVNEINEEMAFVQLRGRIIRTETLGDKRAKRFIAHFKAPYYLLPLTIISPALAPY